MKNVQAQKPLIVLNAVLILARLLLLVLNLKFISTKALFSTNRMILNGLKIRWATNKFA